VSIDAATARRPAQIERAEVAVVIPIPNDPDWSIFEALAEEVPIIVVDDSDGKLATPPRKNVRVFDYAAQRRVMGEHYPAIPHRSAATRNFGHYLAFREGLDVIVALDYDCQLHPHWLDQHLAMLGRLDDGPALEGDWINTVEVPGFYARGFPYEFRGPGIPPPAETSAGGEVKLNMGVWDHVVDLNGIDKLQRQPPTEPGLRGERNYVALGNLPLCGMNTAFRAELVPAYFFLPDIWIDGWQLSRHDDIWGGYILKKLMDRRGDLVSFGRPVVTHTRQSNLQRVVTMEHYMHLMAREFYEIVDAAVEEVRPDAYGPMFAHFVGEYRRGVESSRAPAPYRTVYRELGLAMQRWAACFS
jgi:hypothetical protein